MKSFGWQIENSLNLLAIGPKAIHQDIFSTLFGFTLPSRRQRKELKLALPLYRVSMSRLNVTLDVTPFIESEKAWITDNMAAILNGRGLFARARRKGCWNVEVRNVANTTQTAPQYCINLVR